jgi:hypothetical protein
VKAPAEKREGQYRNSRASKIVRNGRKTAYFGISRFLIAGADGGNFLKSGMVSCSVLGCRNPNLAGGRECFFEKVDKVMSI